MKATLDRTKVVLRHLPPAFTESMLIEQVDSVFAGRYNWLSFSLGKSSQKHNSYSRAYIDFKRPEDVLEFAEFFNGHVFVNEKGSQFKIVVEYAPSQQVPKQWSKKDGREGTIFKDPEYMEFLEVLAKPVENLPSAEIQLERREAERAGVPKDPPIITPLMDFVRQKRAAKGGSRRSLSNGKLNRRTGGSSGGSPSSASSKRGSEKRQGSAKMYVLRDSLKRPTGKDKSAIILVSKRDDKQLSDKPVKSVSSAGTEISEEESGTGVYGIPVADKKKVLILKGKDKELSHVAGSMLGQQNVSSPINTKQNSRREGRMIKGILLCKDARQSSGVQSEPHIQTLHGSEKTEQHSRNKDRQDRGLWILRHSDGSYANDESLTTSASQSAQIHIDTSEGAYGESKVDFTNVRNVQVRTVRSGRSSSLDNGIPKHVSRRGAVANGSSFVKDGKPGKRSSAAGYDSHERQVWVQKSISG